MTLGQAFKAIRGVSRYSQREFAALLGITNVHLCLIEKGKNLPSLPLIEAARRETGLDPYLLAAVSNGMKFEKYKIMSNLAKRKNKR